MSKFVSIKASDPHIEYNPPLDNGCNQIGECWVPHIVSSAEDETAGWDTISSCGPNPRLLLRFQGTAVSVNASFVGKTDEPALAELDGGRETSVPFASRVLDLNASLPIIEFENLNPNITHTLNISHSNKASACIHVLSIGITYPSTLASPFRDELTRTAAGYPQKMGLTMSVLVAIIASSAVCGFCGLVLAVVFVWRCRRRRGKRHDDQLRSVVVTDPPRLQPYRITQAQVGVSEPSPSEQKREATLREMKGESSAEPVWTRQHHASAPARATTPEDGEADQAKLTALRIAIRRTGFSLDALLASLERIGTWQIHGREARSEIAVSDAPPPTYLS